MRVNTKFGTVEYKPVVGSYVELDNGMYECLEADDLGISEFRLRAGGGLYSLAANVEVSGRTLQHRGGSLMVRVKVTFVADKADEFFLNGERNPEFTDQVVRGWMYVTPENETWLN